MVNLDSIEEINKFNKGEVYESIIALPDQVEQAWSEVVKGDIPESCSLVKNVVIAGMGGSALGGRVVDSMIQQRSRVPIEVFTEFHIPNYVNSETLVIVSSYSGNTEETLSDFYEAINKKATVMAITTGGKLAEKCKEENIPAYIFDPAANPSGQPRLALGYSIAAIVGILTRCSFIHLTNGEMTSLIGKMREYTKRFEAAVGESENKAKKQARLLAGKLPVLVASEHLIGSTHIMKNQLNETAKTFSVMFDIPEANHHLMEGLRYPAKVRDLLYFLFIESNNYGDNVKKRYPITREVVEKNEIKTGIYTTEGATRLEDIFEMLIFSSFVQFYLAMIYGADPVAIPWVDYFKEKLKAKV